MLAVRAHAQARRGDAVLGAALVAARLRRFSLRDCHQRPRSIATRARRPAVDWGENAGGAWLAVLDEGPGITAGEEKALFERFGRGSAGRSGPGGTGLGLTIVETLAHRWGGAAAIGNRDGGGMRAEIRLPKRG
jgi:signal transduction histidine kinase